MHNRGFRLPPMLFWFETNPQSVTIKNKQTLRFLVWVTWLLAINCESTQYESRSTVSDSVTGEERCHRQPAPMTTKIGTVVIYSHSKLVLKYLGMNIKISRLRLVLLHFVDFPLQPLHMQPLHVKEM